MLILDDKSDVMMIESIHTPILSDSFWVLDLEMMDFTITPLLTLEETISSSMEIQIEGFSFHLPTNWNILVIDEETSQLDIIESSNLAGRDFTAFIYGSNSWSYRYGTIKVIDFSTRQIHTGPSLNKSQMLCHPISDNSWVNIAPSDTFNKYLKNKSAGDLI